MSHATTIKLFIVLCSGVLISKPSFCHLTGISPPPSHTDGRLVQSV